MMNAKAENKTEKPAPQNDWLELVRKQVENLKYGVVVVTVHDGRVVQIEKSEKTRLQ